MPYTHYYWPNVNNIINENILNRAFFLGAKPRLSLSQSKSHKPFKMTAILNMSRMIYFDR